MKTAGKVQYQIVSFYWVLRKEGVVIKIPKKVGKTNSEPKKYQVFRLPAGHSNLSDITPTNGVVIPSVTYPESRPAAAILGLNPTTYRK